MNGDDSSFYKLPDTDEEASQYLFLYELSLGYGMDLTDQINVDRSAVKITAYVQGQQQPSSRVGFKGPKLV